MTNNFIREQFEYKKERPKMIGWQRPYGEVDASYHLLDILENFEKRISRLEKYTQNLNEKKCVNCSTAPKNIKKEA